MRYAIQEQQVYGGRIEKIKIDQVHDAGLLTKIAKKKYVFEADVDSATALLRQALISAPYSIPAWLSLAELYNDQGKKKQAFQVLEYADQLTSEIKRWRWDKTLVDYQVGRTDVLSKELSYIISEIPGKPRADALQLAFTLWEDPDELLDNVGRSNLEHFLDYTIRKRLPHKGLFFWRVSQKDGIFLSEKKMLSFIDMLINSGELVAASAIWRTHFNIESVLFNGDFQRKFLQHAFGWRQSKNKAFTLRHERKDDREFPGILHYNFKGWDNVNFRHLYQIVPVDGGQHYAITGEIKSKRLSTDQRPFIEIYGYKCKTPYAKSEMVEADQDWARFEVVFGVSEECDAVVVRLRRRESNQIDNKLKGQMWLRNFEMLQTGDIFTVFDERPE
ncbi:MAG: tetratricopeptide (TPR) repeat protein [Desulforhopalus sp.]|jgi:tetratricopeptide (TPR) repeat protein